MTTTKKKKCSKKRERKKQPLFIGVLVVKCISLVYSVNRLLPIFSYMPGLSMIAYTRVFIYAYQYHFLFLTRWSII